jgi:hypothetical protein
MKQKGTFPKQMKQKRKMKMFKSKMGTILKMNFKNRNKKLCCYSSYYSYMLSFFHSLGPKA